MKQLSILLPIVAILLFGNATAEITINENSVIKTKEPTFIKTYPLKQSNILYVVESNTILLLQQEKDGWLQVKIENNGKTGWVEKSKVKIINQPNVQEEKSVEESKPVNIPSRNDTVRIEKKKELTNKTTDQDSNMTSDLTKNEPVAAKKVHWFEFIIGCVLGMIFIGFISNVKAFKKRTLKSDHKIPELDNFKARNELLLASKEIIQDYHQMNVGGDFFPLDFKIRQLLEKFNETIGKFESLSMEDFEKIGYLAQENNFLREELKKNKKKF